MYSQRDLRKADLPLLRRLQRQVESQKIQPTTPVLSKINPNIFVLDNQKKKVKKPKKNPQYNSTRLGLYMNKKSNGR